MPWVTAGTHRRHEVLRPQLLGRWWLLARKLLRHPAAVHPGLASRLSFPARPSYSAVRVRVLHALGVLIAVRLQ